MIAESSSRQKDGALRIVPRRCSTRKLRFACDPANRDPATVVAASGGELLRMPAGGRPS